MLFLYCSRINQQNNIPVESNKSSLELPHFKSSSLPSTNDHGRYTIQQPCCWGTRTTLTILINFKFPFSNEGFSILLFFESSRFEFQKSFYHRGVSGFFKQSIHSLVLMSFTFENRPALFSASLKACLVVLFLPALLPIVSFPCELITWRVSRFSCPYLRLLIGIWFLKSPRVLTPPEEDIDGACHVQRYSDSEWDFMVSKDRLAEGVKISACRKDSHVNIRIVCEVLREVSSEVFDFFCEWYKVSIWDVIVSANYFLRGLNVKGKTWLQSWI